MGKRNLNKKAQALIETVIVIPVSVILIVFTIQTALLYNSYIVVNYASYCGARAGSVQLSGSGSNNFNKASSIAKRAVNTILILYSPKEAIFTQTEVSREGKTFKVKVTYPAKLFIKLFGFLPNIDITATSRMVIEQ